MINMPRHETEPLHFVARTKKPRQIVSVRGLVLVLLTVDLDSACMAKNYNLVACFNNMKTTISSFLDDLSKRRIFVNGSTGAAYDTAILGRGRSKNLIDPS